MVMKVKNLNIPGTDNSLKAQELLAKEGFVSSSPFGTIRELWSKSPLRRIDPEGSPVT